VGGWGVWGGSGEDFGGFVLLVGVFFVVFGLGVVWVGFFFFLVGCFFLFWFPPPAQTPPNPGVASWFEGGLKRKSSIPRTWTCGAAISGKNARPYAQAHSLRSQPKHPTKTQPKKKKKKKKTTPPQTSHPTHQRKKSTQRRKTPPPPNNRQTPHKNTSPRVMSCKHPGTTFCLGQAIRQCR